MCAYVCVCVRASAFVRVCMCNFFCKFLFIYVCVLWRTVFDRFPLKVIKYIHLTSGSLSISISCSPISSLLLQILVINKFFLRPSFFLLLSPIFSPSLSPLHPLSHFVIVYRHHYIQCEWWNSVARILDPIPGQETLDPIPEQEIFSCF